MRAMITFDGKNFNMTIFCYKEFCDIKTDLETSIKVPIKTCFPGRSCMETCSLKNICSPALYEYCGELGRNFPGFEFCFDIPESDFYILYGTIQKIKHFPKRGVLFKKRETELKRKKEK